MNRVVHLVAGALAVAAVLACDSRRSGTTTGSEEPLTFTRHIAPIVFTHCVPCHRPGESAPFSLLSYKDVRQRAATIVDVVGRRYMPPWLPAPGHGDFGGARRLADDQIEKIRRWYEQGSVEGNPQDLPPVPQFADTWQLGPPDLVVKLPKPYVLEPGAGDVWRNFVVPAVVTSGRYVKTIDIRPGSARFVHHALVAVDPTRASRDRDQADPAPGFGGMDMGSAQAPDGHLLGWTPGMSAFPGLPGKAWRLDPDTDFVMQVHLLPTGKAEHIDPSIGVYFSDAPPTPPAMSLLRLDADQQLDIPVGARQFVVTDSFTLPVDVELYAVYPHAHFLATKIEGSARRSDGTEQPLIRIERWDFRWQEVYRYVRPVFLPRGSTLSMRIEYDNSADNPRNPSHPPRRVVAGPGSLDEMAHLQLQVLPKSDDDAVVLKAAWSRHLIAKNASDPWAYYELGNALRDQGRVNEAVAQYRAAIERDPRHAASHNNLGVALTELGAVDDAIGHYRRALQDDPEFADAHYNLGNALRSTGRTGEAARQYREALRYQPGFAEAHNNLGEILASAGRLDEAMAEFRRAIEIDPQSAQGHNNLGAVLGQRGELDEAMRHFSRALELDPGHAGARENLRLATEAVSSRIR